jgi:precorrin-8X/cobalt-precorrin-8 methylmutase
MEGGIVDEREAPQVAGAIEQQSFAIIESEVPEPRPFQGAEWLVVCRLIHSSADFELLSLVRFHPDAIRAGIGALLRGGLVVTDTEMARVGITRRRIDSLGAEVKCFINEQAVTTKAVKENATRSSTAVDDALARLNGGIYVVGNAPTALLNLLKRVREGQCRPALIVGMPVGFVNAAESKEELMKQSAVPFITIEGRKGGSALAAAVINQLAELALAEKGGR